MRKTGNRKQKPLLHNSRMDRRKNRNQRKPRKDRMEQLAPKMAKRSPQTPPPKDSRIQKEILHLAPLDDSTPVSVPPPSILDLETDTHTPSSNPHIPIILFYVDLIRLNLPSRRKHQILKTRRTTQNLSPTPTTFYLNQQRRHTLRSII